MRDILPDQTARWRRLEERARECMRLYGYGEIRTPIVERAALFDRLGEATEVVEKQMYQFVDKLNGDNLALRPEATAAVARAAIDWARGGAKLFYMGPMFRHERPQKGRQRQFHQIGAEALGYSSPDIDVEMILLCRRLWRECGVENRLRLRLNNLGARDERAAFAARSPLISNRGATNWTIFRANARAKIRCARWTAKTKKRLPFAATRRRSPIASATNRARTTRKWRRVCARPESILKKRRLWCAAWTIII